MSRMQLLTDLVYEDDGNNFVDIICISIQMDKWTLSAAYCSLLEYSLVNTYIIFKEVFPKFQNADTKNTLLHQILSTCSSSTTLHLPLGPADSAPTADCFPHREWEQIEKGRLQSSHSHTPILMATKKQCELHKRCGAISRRWQCRTKWACSWCGVYLHPKFCFLTFHSQADLDSVTFQ